MTPNQIVLIWELNTILVLANLFLWAIIKELKGGSKRKQDGYTRQT
jgi:hypothetical protein